MKSIMRVSVCVGNYAKTSYCIPGLELQVFCMEELCYCLRENAFLLDMTLLDEGLVSWIERECGITELASMLYPLVRKQGSLSAFVTLILDYVGLYDPGTIRELEVVLREGAGLSRIEKRKNQIDYLVGKKKYSAAVHQYEDLLNGWQEELDRGMEMPGNGVKAGIFHNKGVALAGMMEYEEAAEAFRMAYDIGKNKESYMAYFAAKRMELSESDYLSFIAEQPDSYELSLQLERKIEALQEEFQTREAYRKLKDLQEWRFGSDKQRYYEEVEKIARALKETYRCSVNE